MFFSLMYRRFGHMTLYKLSTSAVVHPRSLYICGHYTSSVIIHLWSLHILGHYTFAVIIHPQSLYILGYLTSVVSRLLFLLFANFHPLFFIRQFPPLILLVTLYWLFLHVLFLHPAIFHPLFSSTILHRVFYIG